MPAPFIHFAKKENMIVLDWIMFKVVRIALSVENHNAIFVRKSAPKVLDSTGSRPNLIGLF